MIKERGECVKRGNVETLDDEDIRTEEFEDIVWNMW